MENEVCPDKACGSNVPQIDSSTAQCLSPYPLSQTESCGLCKCKKTFSETLEVGTQTVPTVETCDASTQCDSVAKDTEFSLYFPPVATSVQHAATGRQTNTAAEPRTHKTSSGNWGGGKSMPWSNKPKDYFLSASCTINKLNNSDSSVILQSSINPFLDPLIMADDKGITYTFNIKRHLRET